MTGHHPHGPPARSGFGLPPIRLDGDPVLRTPTEPVVTFDEGLHHLVETMFTVMYAAGGVGLAANQIGVARSVFVMDCAGTRAVVVNPVLDLREVPMVVQPEGCLSVPGRHYPTARASRTSVTGLDHHQRPVRPVGEGLVARCLQHEVDHLRGHLFLDRLDPTTRRQARADVTGDQRAPRSAGNPTSR